jgi:hypothetical protein
MSSPSLALARGAGDGLGFVEGLDASEVHKRLGRCARLGDVGAWGLARYLLDVEERGLYQAYGEATTVAYAEAFFDLEPRRTRELLHAARRLRELPKLERAFCAQELGWTKVLLLLRVLRPEHPEHHDAWIEFAGKKNCRALKIKIQISREGGPLRGYDEKGLPEIRFRESVTLGPVAYQMLDLAKKKLSAELGRPASAAELQEVMLDLYLRMENDGKVDGWKQVSSSLYRIVMRPLVLDGDAPLFVETDDGPLRVDGSDVDDVLARQRGSCATCDGEGVDDDEPGPGESPRRELDRTTPPRMRRRVLERDGHRCRCCGRRIPLHVHHIDFRSEGGPTRMWNLIAICLRCGVRARTVTLRLPAFTLLAATSDPDELPEPLVTRFLLRETLAEYDEADLAALATRVVGEDGLALEPEAARRLALCARGRPREVRRLAERLLNRARAEGVARIDDRACDRALRAMGYDRQGLLPEERRYLRVLRASRAPVPGGRLAQMAGLCARRVLREMEPWLCRKGLVRVTPRGRVPGPRLAAEAS